MLKLDDFIKLLSEDQEVAIYHFDHNQKLCIDYTGKVSGVNINVLMDVRHVGSGYSFFVGDIINILVAPHKV